MAWSSARLDRGQPPGCLGALFALSSTHFCMGLGVLPIPILLRMTNDHRWLPVVYLPYLLLVWIGGTMVLSRYLGHLWLLGRRARVLGVLILQWAGAIACVAVVMTTQPNYSRFSNALNPYAEEYWNLPERGEPADHSHLRGKCAIVTARYGHPPTIDRTLHSDLPSALRAETDEEVRTIVRLNWSNAPVPDVPGGWIDVCEVRLIDRTTGQRIGKQTFRGEWREVTLKKKGRIWIGTLETGPLAEWLRGLPRER